MCPALRLQVLQPLLSKPGIAGQVFLAARNAANQVGLQQISQLDACQCIACCWLFHLRSKNHSRLCAALHCAQVTLGGTKAGIVALLQATQGTGLKAVQLAVQHAFHGPHVAAVQGEFAAELAAAGWAEASMKAPAAGQTACCTCWSAGPQQAGNPKTYILTHAALYFIRHSGVCCVLTALLVREMLATHSSPSCCA
jgi:acyl transferase domain-containing protein